MDTKVQKEEHIFHIEHIEYCGIMRTDGPSSSLKDLIAQKGGTQSTWSVKDGVLYFSLGPNRSLAKGRRKFK